MNQIKILLKDYLKDKERIYEFILILWKIINYPKNLFLKLRNKSIKKKYFDEFRLSNGIIEIKHGEFLSKFHTSSKFEYYKIKIGSQFENVFFEKLFKIIKKGMTIYDIGGSVGIYTIPFANKVGSDGKVFVFEPTQKGCSSIESNLKLNNLQNVTIYPYAVSDINSTSSFYIRPDKETHSLFEKTVAPSKIAAHKEIKVKTFTIDYLIEKKLTSPPNIIKIDTEGAEIKILDGMTKIINSLEYILIEIHKPALKLENIINPEKIIENKLKKLGFKKFDYLSGSHLLASKI